MKPHRIIKNSFADSFINYVPMYACVFVNEIIFTKSTAMTVNLI